MVSEANPHYVHTMKLVGPQSPAALEFVSMEAGMKQMQQRVQSISGLGQAATVFFYLYESCEYLR